MALRVLLVVVLAPSCALAAALAKVVLTSALLTALVPHETPAGPSEPPERIELTEPEATSERTGPETLVNGTPTPSPSATPSPSTTASASPSP
jgi:hypothetical protein